MSMKNRLQLVDIHTLQILKLRIIEVKKPIMARSVVHSKEAVQ